MIQEYNGVKVGESYIMTNGYYVNQRLRVDWISSTSNIIIDGNKYRQVSGVIVGINKKTNHTAEHLVVSFEEMSNLQIIQLCLLKNPNALLEFKKRYKFNPRIK